MNQTSSPVLQTNDINGKYSPDQDRSPCFRSDRQRDMKKTNGTFMLCDDLQKIRRSNHSSHHARRREAEDEDMEHDDFIKGMWYPGLESTLDESAEFFDDYCPYEEEDYLMEEVAAVPPVGGETLGSAEASMNVSDHHSTLEFILMESAQLHGSTHFSATLSSQDMFSRGMGELSYDDQKLRM